MKVALIHDWLTGMRGGERCLEEFLALYPTADILTLIHIPGATSEKIDARVTQTSFLNKLPSVNKYYRWLLPLYPLAVRDLKLDGYDLIISLSHAGAKNIQVPNGSCHICYCFTPMRYAWDQMLTYFGTLSYIFAPILLLLRIWDRLGSKRVTEFVAISRFVAARIRCFYHRESSVIFPPIKDFWLQQELPQVTADSSAFLYAGALVPYKNVTQIVEAFNANGLPLIIAGKGPQLEKLKALANSNVRFTGAVSDQQLADLYRSAKALIFAAKEDFGLIPIESLACGLPVIGPYAGALKESLNNLKYWSKEQVSIAPVTGVYYRYDIANLAAEIQKGVNFFLENKNRFSAIGCRQHAQDFAVGSFTKKWGLLLNKLHNSGQLAQ